MRIILFLLVFLIGCTHLAEDIGPSPADHNYRRMEFTTNLNGNLVKEIGTANISIRHGESVSNFGVTVHGYNTGKLVISSRNCLFSELFTRYENSLYIPLESIMPAQSTAYRCIYDLQLAPDQVSDKEDRAHNVKMIGRILVNYLPEGYENAGIEYIQANSSASGTYLKYYHYEGQGSIQILEGKLSHYIGFNIDSPSLEGQIILTGCGYTNSNVREYNTNFTNLTFREVFGKEDITPLDSCLLEINYVPWDIAAGYMARFDLNVYGKAVVRLEEPRIRVYKKVYEYIEVSSMPYAIVQSINDKVCIQKNKCKVRYYKDKEYWIRSITKNGRYRVLMYKNGNIEWRE